MYGNQQNEPVHKNVHSLSLNIASSKTPSTELILKTDHKTRTALEGDDGLAESVLSRAGESYFD